MLNEKYNKYILIVASVLIIGLIVSFGFNSNKTNKVSEESTVTADDMRYVNNMTSNLTKIASNLTDILDYAKNYDFSSDLWKSQFTSTCYELKENADLVHNMDAPEKFQTVQYFINLACESFNDATDDFIDGANNGLLYKMTDGLTKISKGGDYSSQALNELQKVKSDYNIK